MPFGVVMVAGRLAGLLILLNHFHTIPHGCAVLFPLIADELVEVFVLLGLNHAGGEVCCHWQSSISFSLPVVVSNSSSNRLEKLAGCWI